jgi:hypothetical protein
VVVQKSREKFKFWRAQNKISLGFKNCQKRTTGF